MVTLSLSLNLNLSLSQTLAITLDLTLALTLTQLSNQGEQRPSIVTAFCALQDIGPEMGPTLFLPRTHTAAAHADFYTYANFDLAFSSVDEEVS